MLLNARKLFYEEDTRSLILLAIEDVTERRAAQREAAELLQQRETLLREMQRRVADGLQIIASILLLKARAVGSQEVRGHLQDAPAGHVGGGSAATATGLQPRKASRSGSAPISPGCARAWRRR